MNEQQKRLLKLLESKLYFDVSAAVLQHSKDCRDLGVAVKEAQGGIELIIVTTLVPLLGFARSNKEDPKIIIDRVVEKSISLLDEYDAHLKEQATKSAKKSKFNPNLN